MNEILKINKRNLYNMMHKVFGHEKGKELCQELDKIEIDGTFSGGILGKEVLPENDFQLLSRAFSWCKSPQKLYFWYNICEKIMEWSENK